MTAQPVPTAIKLSEQIDKWIANEGKGNVRDALNIALGRLESADDLIQTLQDEIAYLQDQCDSLMMEINHEYRNAT